MEQHRSWRFCTQREAHQAREQRTVLDHHKKIARLRRITQIARLRRISQIARPRRI